MKKLASFAVLAVSLSGCVSTYKIPAGSTGPTARLKDTATQTGSMKAEAFQVSKINGLRDTMSPMATPYGGGMSVSLKESSRAIPAGSPITVTLSGGNIYAADGAALADMMSGNAKKSVVGDVVFIPKANGVYKVCGNAGKDSSSIWIEEEGTRKIVTQKITKN